MRTVRFLEEAQGEFLEQISYYEAQQKGLGNRFREAVESAIVLAATHPNLGSAWKFRTRRVFIKGFPFALVYRVEPATLVVFAVAHFKRRPAYWRRRK